MRTLVLAVMLATTAVCCTPAALSPSHLFSEPRALVQQHTQARAGLIAIQAEARVDQRGDQGRVRGTVMMFVERVGRVRFDVMTQFGPILTLTSDGEQFALSDLREHEFTTGPACEQNIARLLGLPVSAPQAAALLLGGVPELGAADEELVWRPELGVYVVTRTAGTLELVMHLALRTEDERAALAQQRFRLVRSSLSSTTGHVFWQAEYEDYRPVRGADGATHDVPFTVHVTQPSSETDTLVKFQEVTPNPDIPDGAFLQSVPPGVTTVESPCDE